MATVGSTIALWSGRALAIGVCVLLFWLATRLEWRTWEAAMPCLGRLCILAAFLVVPAAVSGVLTLLLERRRRPEGPAAIGTALAVIVASDLLVLLSDGKPQFMAWSTWIQGFVTLLLHVWLQVMVALPLLMVLAKLLERRSQAPSHE